MLIGLGLLTALSGCSVELSQQENYVPTPTNTIYNPDLDTSTTLPATDTPLPLANATTEDLDPRVDLYPGQYFVYWADDEAWIGSQNEIAVERWLFRGNLSPDGTKFAYSENQQIYIYDSLSDKVQEIEIDDFHILEMSDPTWSPDAGLLAFAASTIRIEEGVAIADEFPSIYIYSFEDERTYQVTDWPTFEVFPVWSPDGEYLAFAADVQHVSTYGNTSINQMDLFLVQTECLSNPTSCAQRIQPITNMGRSASATMPSWSADSESIAFRCAFMPVQEDDVLSDYQTDICTVNRDGTNLLNITNTPDINETRPVWSDVGSLLAYTAQSFQADQYEYDDDIYIVSIPDGTLLFHSNTVDTDERFQFWVLIE